MGTSRPVLPRRVAISNLSRVIDAGGERVAKIGGLLAGSYRICWMVSRLEDC
jgi:hypothetical protein